MADQSAVQKALHERQCVHRAQGVDGEYYRGESYIAALKGLRAEKALKISGQVEAFFWSDAERIKVWLCSECAAELKLS
jgi:hypothetical protein